MDSRKAGPSVVVTVGTDHHPFSRLITWMDRWAQDNSAYRVTIQHGTSTPPEYAEGVALMSRTELMDLLERADAVVCQAGPGSILDARRAGKVPIVVPRLQRLGEVVDDHQVAFAWAMAARGEAIVATTAEEVHFHLSAALADPTSVRRPPAASPAADTGRKVETALRATVSRPPGLLNLRRVRDLVTARRRGSS